MKETKDVGKIAIGFFKKNSHILLVIGSLAMIIFLVAGSLSSCSMMFGGTGNAVVGTSYTAEDEDIRGAEAVGARYQSVFQKYITCHEDKKKDNQFGCQ